MFQKNSNKQGPSRYNDTMMQTKQDVVASHRKAPPTIISTDLRILGNLISEGIVDIDGRVEGNIHAESVYIRENGMVIGDIVASNDIHVFGAVHGVIKSMRVAVQLTGHIEGAIIHKSLSIEDGAYVDAQFKPFNSQARVAEEASNIEEAANEFATGTNAQGYDILKDYKLIN